MTIPVGEKIVVRGYVDDDFRSVFRPEFYAFEITRADGSVIKLVGLVKSHQSRHPGESRGPEVLGIPRFRLPPE